MQFIREANGSRKELVFLRKPPFTSSICSLNTASVPKYPNYSIHRAFWPRRLPAIHSLVLTDLRCMPMNCFQMIRYSFM